MTKREFIIQFVLNRAHADRVTDAPFWVEQADAAWRRLEKTASESVKDRHNIMENDE